MSEFFPERLPEQETHLRAGCKINLFLEITGILPDGRHSLRTLFWPLTEPHDTLHLRAGTPDTASTGIRLSCTAPEVDPEHNTVVRAGHAFARATGYAPALHITLEKGIPSGAGLGGASADAAALLMWLNTHAPCPLSPEQLVQVAVSVGADIPFFLRNSPALGTGVGEVLVPCPPAALYEKLWLVLVCPPVPVDTGAAFRAFDTALSAEIDQIDNPNTLFLPHWCTELLTNPDSQTSNADPERVHELRNSLEPVVFAMYPELNRLKTTFLREGAAATAMSGSGSTVFGLFREKTRATRAAQAVQPFGQVWVQRL